MAFFHVTAIIATVLAVLYADEQAFRWFTGSVRTLSRKKVEWMHVTVGVGLALVILTGGLMFVTQAGYLLQDPVFRIKLLFVAALIINTFFIERLSHAATAHPFVELSRKKRTQLFVAGAVSLSGWIGAGICGLIIGGIL